MDVSEYLRVCEEAVRTGGRVVQDWIGRIDVREKGPADLVTQADLASQEAVRATVLGAFPEHCLLGEEHATDGRGATTERAEYRWIVDPLDGTTNFVHGVPHYCVSLALERNGELLVGAVYDPVLDECFTAARGQGARLNGRPIQTSGVSALKEALAAVGFPPNPQGDSPDLLMFLAMLGRCQAIRRTGSTALNLCYMAAGRFDVYWSYSAKIWDVAAGVLILGEAGGCISSPAGGVFCLEEADFLAAANRGLHAKLREIAAEAIGGTPRPGLFCRFSGHFMGQKLYSCYGLKYTGRLEYPLPTPFYRRSVQREGDSLIFADHRRPSLRDGARAVPAKIRTVPSFGANAAE